MSKILFDTCTMLNLQDEIFNVKGEIFISSLSLVELENIKNSGRHDEEIKYSVRQLLHLLEEKEGQFKIILYHTAWDEILVNNGYLINNDSRIIATAFYNQMDFITDDLICKELAKTLGVSVQFSNRDEEIYLGFKEIQLEDEELAEFYSKIVPENENRYGLIINQYLIVKDQTGIPIDSYCWVNEYRRVGCQRIDSKMFGKIKPKDIYQQIAIHSMRQNAITMLAGKPGGGKFLLTLSYLYSVLEKGELDRLVIFCNPVIAKGAAKLGFYPGDRSSKILDSNVGGVLETKFGDRLQVERMLEDGTLMLVPAGDARGLDLTGFRSGVWILESQNLDKNLMKIFLQRLGQDSKCIIDGDYQNQTDSELYSGNRNGMRRVLEVFKGKSCFGAINLQNIYRSEIAKIAEEI